MASLRDKSIFLSLILRHKPEVVGLALDDAGWIRCDDLIEAVKDHKKSFTIDDLVQIVESDNKGRYSFDNGSVRIRANQGHSIKVDVGMEPATPPDVLYHGTSVDVFDNIMKYGLHSGSRLHVHMSEDHDTATTVGGRHGIPVVLFIDAKQMHEDGVPTWLSKNGVWLAETVDTKYIFKKHYLENDCGEE